MFRAVTLASETASWVDRELMLTEMLDDPIVRDLMHSDGVDRREVECLMASLRARRFHRAA